VAGSEIGILCQLCCRHDVGQQLHALSTFLVHIDDDDDDDDDV